MDSCGPPISVLTAHDEPSSNRVRQQSCADREIAGRIAGEGGYGGAGNELKWDQDTIADLGVPEVRPEVDGSGGATAVSGGANTGNAATALELERGQVGATPSTSGALGTLRHDPEAPRSPEASWRRRMAAAGPKRGKPARAKLS